MASAHARLQRRINCAFSSSDMQVKTIRTMYKHKHFKSIGNSAANRTCPFCKHRQILHCRQWRSTALLQRATYGVLCACTLTRSTVSNVVKTCQNTWKNALLSRKCSQITENFEVTGFVAAALSRFPGGTECLDPCISPPPIKRQNKNKNKT